MGKSNKDKDLAAVPDTAAGSFPLTLSRISVCFHSLLDSGKNEGVEILQVLELFLEQV